jgi:hypothetical protein
MKSLIEMYSTRRSEPLISASDLSHAMKSIDMLAKLCCVYHLANSHQCLSNLEMALRAALSLDRLDDCPVVRNFSPGSQSCKNRLSWGVSP